MKLKSFLRRFFLGNEVLEKVHSSLNGEILVVEDLFGKKEMIIGKVAQSGGLAEKLWREGIKEILRYKDIRKLRVLILGLGAGTLASLIAKRYPLNAEIVGVEIDPKVVEIGKKYFGLDKIPNLKIVVGDAIEMVRSEKLARSGKWDLIIVDLYVGQEFPEEAESEDFLRNVASSVNKDGLALFNRLYYNRQHQKMANRLVKKLTTIFPRVKTKKLYTNVLISASF